MNSRPALLILTVALAVAGCGLVDRPAATSPTPDPELGARETLRTFFNLLSLGRYAEAAALYGGSLEVLREMNPELDPLDTTRLLRNACEVNGFQCLPILEIRSFERTSSRDFMLEVTFEAEGGGEFIREACCVSDDQETPSETVFRFEVAVSDSGAFQVMDLPVYVP